MPKLSLKYYLLIILSSVGYALIAYVFKRYETLLLLPTYGVLFLLYLWFARNVKAEEVFTLILTSFLFRAIFLFALPSLSDDFYRFIWDGRLWNAGYHPFVKLPSEYVAMGIDGINQELFQKLNSPEYFTVYPPVSQLIFWLSTKVFPDSILGAVVFMRLIILCAELGTILSLRRLLIRFSLPDTRVLWYALNPLVIVELTGNLHFEALVIFFIVFGMLLLVKNQVMPLALSFSLAIATKLVPVIFIPALVQRIGVKRSIGFVATISILLPLCFLPIFNIAAFRAMTESVGLYFNKFEFNASVYYLVREWGWWYYGYNIIQTVGWKLGVVAASLILFLAFRKGVKWQGDFDFSHPYLFADFMWALIIYFLFTTTLHPWYITTLLAVSIFTNYKFPIIWSALIFLTYAGYSQNGFNENYWLTAFEYLSVIGYLVYELWIYTKSKSVTVS